MIQEIIAYMIIGAAVYAAISKTIKSFTGKKVKPKKIDFKTESFSMQHNCGDCQAECMLRDKIAPLTKNEDELCKKIEIKPGL